MPVPFEVELFQTLQSSISTVTGRAARVGYPVWSRQNLTLPVIALVTTGLGPSATRMGQPVSRFDLDIVVFLFGEDEWQKLQMIGEIARWHRANPSHVIQGERVSLKFREAKDYAPETRALQEQYGFYFLFTADSALGGN